MRMHPIFALIATLGFVCAALLGFVPATPKGVQCPTAVVQAVAERDCCGRLVVRKPRPGDRAFVQCACAEKKAASTKAVLVAKVHLCLPPPTLAVEPPAPVPFHTIPRSEVTFRSTDLVPPTPPPA